VGLRRRRTRKRSDKNKKKKSKEVMTGAVMAAPGHGEEGAEQGS
jgi:hypothetical protein